MSDPASGGSSTVTTTLDPVLQDLLKLFQGQLLGGIGATGGASFFGMPSGAIGSLSPEEEAIRQSALGFYRNAPLIHPLEEKGLGLFGEAADPTLRLGAAKKYLEDIAGPQLLNTSIAGGFGGARGGAGLEALGRAGTELTLPISRDVAEAQQMAGRANLGLGGILEGRQRGRFGQSMELSGLPRSLQVADFIRRQNFFQSLLSGIPTFSSGTSTTTAQQPGLNWLQDLLVPFGSAILPALLPLMFGQPKSGFV